MTLMKLRLGFLFKDLSQHFRMYLVVFALKFFNSWSWARGDIKSFTYLCREIKKSYNRNPNIKP